MVAYYQQMQRDQQQQQIQLREQRQKEQLQQQQLQQQHHREQLQQQQLREVLQVCEHFCNNRRLTYHLEERSFSKLDHF